MQVTSRSDESKDEKSDERNGEPRCFDRTACISNIETRRDVTVIGHLNGTIIIDQIFAMAHKFSKLVQLNVKKNNRFY